jgi:transcriptional regulator with XRE-family HTH domain
MRTDRQSHSRQWSIRSAADLGRAIAGVREQRGLTQQRLADRAGLERSYLARLEAGASTLALERALRLLRRMGATVTVTLPADDDGRAD